MAFGSTYRVMPRFKGRVAELKNRLVRARHFRGHGVHSPFVYAIVRQVFMSRGLHAGDTMLHDALIRCGVSRRRAVELQNLVLHCGYGTFALHGAGSVAQPEHADLCILLGGLSATEMLRLVHEASERGTAVAVMAPYGDAERERLCRTIVAEHCSMTVDNRGYLLVFNDRRLPKQHYRI